MSTSDEENAAATYDSAPAVVATHNRRVALPVHVAPAVDERRNTVRPRLVVLACWRLGRALFDFGSSFVRPELRESSGRFADHVRSHPDALLSVFGHADPVGDDAFNKKLGARRAAAVYGLLTRNVALWEKLATEPLGADVWGTAATQRMLATLVDPESPDAGAYFVREVNGVLDGATMSAVRAFQKHNGLTVDGAAGPLTRAVLFRLYMDAICVDHAGAPFVVEPDSFVGTGLDPQGKGAYQSCGEFNPVRLFSKADEKKYAGGAKADERDERNAVNRRAMVFLFHPSAPRDPSQWPCPRADEPGDGCREMFWPDGDARRKPGEEEREYRTDRATMACSWYDRFARRSPCEGVVIIPMFRVRLFDVWGHAIENAPWAVEGEGFAQSGVAADGTAVLRNVKAPSTCVVRWSRPDEERRRYLADPTEPLAPFEYELEVTVDFDALEDEASVAEGKLDNLGYAAQRTVEAKVRAFQRDLGRPQTGALADVQSELDARHEAVSPVQHTRPRPPQA